MSDMGGLISQSPIVAGRRQWSVRDALLPQRRVSDQTPPRADDHGGKSGRNATVQDDSTGIRVGGLYFILCGFGGFLM